MAIYRRSDLARLTADLNPNTSAQAWDAAPITALMLEPGTLYFVAVSVDTTDTTAGIQCLSGTGRIGVLPGNWPGSLDHDNVPGVTNVGFAQFAVTAGALPATAPALAPQGAWTGGMPAIFLDSV
jgi:hypothetical protein